MQLKDIQPNTASKTNSSGIMSKIKMDTFNEERRSGLTEAKTEEAFGGLKKECVGMDIKGNFLNSYKCMHHQRYYCTRKDYY